MQHCAQDAATDPCVLDGIRPFLTELQVPVSLSTVPPAHPLRPALEGFIHDVFAHAYGADVQTFYPTLLGFRSDQQLRAAVGYRDGSERPLFSEQYLPRAARHMIATKIGTPVADTELVEVGNLALAGMGDARWVIAAVTVFLYQLGYRWVLFTAVKSLFNAFQRLGLNPIQLAAADPGRLPDGGECWGRYYDARPVVCAGNIAAGYRKLRDHVSIQQPALHTLLNDAACQALLLRDTMQSRFGGV